MKKAKRTVLVLATLEKRLLKNERRIQAISLESYQIREAIAQIKEIEAAKALPPAEKEEIEEQLNEPVEE
jgi:hypothetical protein